MNNEIKCVSKVIAEKHDNKMKFNLWKECQDTFVNASTFKRMKAGR